MKKTILALLMICFLIPGLCLAESENLLKNPSFETLSEDSWPLGWEEDMWIFDAGVSYLEAVPGGVDGENCAMVENVGSNDARFVQAVPVEPNSYYLFSGYVLAEGCDVNFTGANLSVVGCYGDFPSVTDTQGEWQVLQCYLHTGADQKMLDVAVRLGGYSNDTVGRAYFDHLQLKKVTEQEMAENIPMIEVGNTIYSAAEPLPPEPVQIGVESNIPSNWVILLCVAFGAIILALGFDGLSSVRKSYRISLILLFAFAIRLMLSMCCRGYETDMGCFYSWALSMVEYGPADFYELVSFCDYPPGYMLLLWPVGAILRLLGTPAVNAPETLLLLKILPCVADLAAVWLIYRLSGKKMLLAALYAVLPAVWMDGAVWGQIDAILSLGLLCTLMFALKGKWTWALPIFVLTALMKPQALMAAPLGAAALISQWWGHPERSKDILRGLGLSLACFLLMVIPFSFGQSPLWIVEKYASTLGSYPYVTLNAANFWYLLGMNWVSLEGEFLGLTYGSWGTVIMVVILAGAILLYLAKKEIAFLPLCGALVFIALYLFGVKMHERYLFPALLLLSYACVLRPDKRLLASLIGFSFTMAINCALVLADTHLPLGFGFWGCLLAAINLLLFLLTLWAALDQKTMAFCVAEKRPEEEAAGFRSLKFFEKEPMKMEKRDWALMMTLTLVYALVAFIGLGSFTAPQNGWTSTGSREQVFFDLGENRDFSVMYYGGITSKDFIMEFSEDGEHWSDPVPAQMAEGLCFRWLYLREAVYDANGNAISWYDEPLNFTARYARLTANGPSLTLFEVAFRSPEGEAIEVVSVTSQGGREENQSDPAALTDEAQTMPERPSYMNGTYFDEIYHARTGYEHAHEMSTYEWTHPPLGKVFIMWGIQLFGMTAFGWRFFGALAGVLMVPVMYLLGKLLFKKSRWAFFASFLMAFDMMHLTQTRIATVDSYAVLFIMLMYLCMFAYMQMDLFEKKWKTLLPLGLSGLFMGLGCASKWICMYAGVGLAVLFFISLARNYLRYCRMREENDPRAQGFYCLAGGTLLFCVAVFVIIPFGIYYFSYIPHFAYEGGLTWERFWDTQKAIFSYHSGLVDDHGFKSPWYEWPLCLKPMYFYSGTAYAKEGYVASIMCMGNPAIWWAGAAASVYVLIKWIADRMQRKPMKDVRDLLLLLALAAQLVPWVLVPRSTFIYHYFASLPFVMLLTVYAVKTLKISLKVQIFYMALVVLLFIGFYPYATGVEFPKAWADAMNWFSFMKLPGWKYRGWLYY